MRLVENNTYQKKTNAIKLFIENSLDTIKKIEKFFNQASEDGGKRDKIINEILGNDGDMDFDLHSNKVYYDYNYKDNNDLMAYGLIISST